MFARSILKVALSPAYRRAIFLRQVLFARVYGKKIDNFSLPRSVVTKLVLPAFEKCLTFRYTSNKNCQARPTYQGKLVGRTHEKVNLSREFVRKNLLVYMRIWRETHWSHCRNNTYCSTYCGKHVKNSSLYANLIKIFS